MFTNPLTRSRHRTLGLALLSLSAAAVLYACAEMTGIPDNVDADLLVEDMDLWPAEVVVGIGHQVPLRATLLNAKGEHVPGKVDLWESADAGIASVDDAGLVSANAAGTTEVTATANKGNGKSGGKDNAPGQVKKKSKIIVSEETVASVEVVPSALAVDLGTTAQLDAITRDAAGNVLTNRYVEWSSSNTQIATVDHQGAITPVAAGSATITATSEGQEGTATVTVRAIVGLAVWPIDVSLDAGQHAQFYMAIKWSDGQSECDDSSASTEPSVLYNLAAVPAACDSAIALLNR